MLKQIYFSLLKLGLMKQFVKVLDKSERGFDYICFEFSGPSIEKKMSRVFDGPQIRQLLRDISFVSSMNPIKARAWMAFTNVIKDFLANKKTDNYKELMAELLSSFQHWGCNMRIKVCLLKSHLDSFPENLGSVSDEQEERFHQDIKLCIMECCFEGHLDVMADYCWSLVRHKPQASRKRKALKRQFASN